MLTCVVRPIVLIASRYVFNLAGGAVDPPCLIRRKHKSRWFRCVAAQNPEQNLARAIEFIREAAKNGAQIICLPELFRSQYFCQSEDHDNFSLAENIPGPSTDALTKLAREKSRRHRRLAFRKTRRRALSQHRRGDRCRRRNPREISQDAHPGRSVLLRKILFYAGRSRFSELENRARQYRRLRLLGPVVSGSGAPNRFARRGDSFLSDRDRVAPARRRRNMARRNIPPGKRCSAATRSRTAASWRRQIASAMKRRPAAMASNSGAKVSSARPSGEIHAPKDPSIAKKSFRRSGMEAGRSASHALAISARSKSRRLRRESSNG